MKENITKKIIFSSSENFLSDKYVYEVGYKSHDDGIGTYYAIHGFMRMTEVLHTGDYNEAMLSTFVHKYLNKPVRDLP